MPSTFTGRHRTSDRHDRERGEVASWLILGAALALIAASLQPIIAPQFQALAARVGGQTTEAPARNDVQLPQLELQLIEDLPAGAPTEQVAGTLDELAELLDDGDLSNDELDDWYGRFEDLSDEELAYLLDNLTDQQLATLFDSVSPNSFFDRILPDRDQTDFYRDLLDADLLDVLLRLPSEQRQEISEDSWLMLSLAIHLNDEDYLDLLTTLNVDDSNGRLPDGAEADQLIQGFLDPDYLDGPIAAGRTADGQLAIVDQDTYEHAWDVYVEDLIASEYGDLSAAEQAQLRLELAAIFPNVHGFVDHEDRLWVIETSNVGVPIHEALHFYSDDALSERANPLNEGVTEYFNRQILTTVDDPTTPHHEGEESIRLSEAAVYVPNTHFVNDLVDVVGEEVVAGAYFDGDLDSLQDAYIEATGRTEDDFNLMLDLVSGRFGPPAWGPATDLLEETTP